MPIIKKFHFTKKSLDAISFEDYPSSSKQLEFTDNCISALHIVAYPSGKKVFYCRFSYDKKKYSIRLGEHPFVVIPQARKRVAEIKSLVAEGKDPTLHYQRQKMTFQKLALDFYIPFSQATKKSSRSDISKLKTHLLAAFGNTLLVDIRKSDIREYHVSIFKKLAPATANKHLALLKAMFAYAIEKEFMDHSPATGIKAFKENNQRTRFLNKEECIAFIAAANQECNQEAAQLFLFLLTTGVRLGEALSARFENFNQSNNSLYLPETKNGLGRHVNLNAMAVNIITKQSKLHRNDYIFQGKNPEVPMSRPAKAFYRICVVAKINNFRIHDLRHTFASIFVQKGASLYELQRVLGHSTIKMTERYAHLSDTELANATANVSNYLIDQKQTSLPLH